MVQKVCAGVGGGLSVVSLILMIVASLDQRFVTVSLPGVDECEGTDDVAQLGTVGIFKSTFDPACAVQFGPPPVSEGYARFTKAETPTTEFWPLFPAQQGIGGATGLTADDFTTCEEFYAAGGAFEESSLSEFAALETALAEQYQTLSTTVALVFGGVGGALPDLILSSWASGTTTAVLSLANNPSFASAVPGGAAVLTILAAHLQAEVGCGFGAAALGAPLVGCTDVVMNTSSATGEFNIFDILNPAAGVELNALYAGPFAEAFVALTTTSTFMDLGTAQTAFATRFAADDAAAAAFVSGVVSQLEQLVPIILVNGAIVGTAPVPSADLAGFAGLAPAFFNGLLGVGTNATLAADFDFASIKGAIAALDAGARAQGSDALAPATALFNVCIDGSTVNECLANDGLDTSLPSLGDTTPSNYCILAAQEEPFATLLTGTRANDCTFLTLLTAFGGLTVEQVLALLPSDPAAPLPDGIVELIGPALPALVAAITQCAAFDLTLEGCGNELIAPTLFSTLPAIEQGTIPSDATQGRYALCAGLPLSYGPLAVPCAETETFQDFLTATASTLTQVAAALTAAANAPNATAADVAAAAAATAGAASAGEASAVINNCVDVLNITSPGACLGGSVANAFNLANTTEQRIADCNDDEEDLKAFTTAQTMLPPAMALIGLGGIMGIVAAIVNKAPVAFVGGALSVLGAGLVMGALLIVQGAPVYSSVGGDPENFVPLYSADIAQIFALAAIGTGVVGGIVTLVSGCLNKGESETAVSGKVEASY